MVRRWATQNPDQAAEWLIKNTTGPFREQGMGQLTGFWAEKDPQRADQCLKQLPDLPERDGIVQSFVQMVANWAPELGAREALTLTQPGVRDQQVEICVGRWLQTDPSSARQWLEEANLPQDVKDKCLLPLNN